MKTNFEHALALLLVHEGGFVNNPKDPGGMTNLGVTRAVWEAWVGHPVTEAEMRALTPDKVAPLYRRKYWSAVGGDVVSSGLDYCLFDFAVNSGPGRAVKTLQECLGVTVDGALGEATLKAALAVPATQTIDAVCDRRLAFLQALPTWPTFGRGWALRVADVKRDARTLVES